MFLTSDLPFQSEYMECMDYWYPSTHFTPRWREAQTRLASCWRMSSWWISRQFRGLNPWPWDYNPNTLTTEPSGTGVLMHLTLIIIIIVLSLKHLHIVYLDHKSEIWLPIGKLLATRIDLRLFLKFIIILVQLEKAM